MPPTVPGRARRRAAGHSARPDSRAWLGVVRTIAVALLVVVVSGVSVGAIEVWRLDRTVEDRSIDIDPNHTAPAPTIGAFSGAFNILMVGVDNSADQKGFGASRDATLNDVNILVHVSDDHTSGTVVSLPRDLVIAQPECEDPDTRQTYSAVSAQPLNTAYARGGLGCVVDTVKSLTGVDIPYAALFTFEGTVAMADAVGGVQVCLSKAVDDPDSGLKLKAGTSTISGRTALAFLRDRHGIGDGSDLSRIASQQQYMSSLLRKMTSSATLTSPAKLYALANAATQNVQLSTSLARVDTLVTMMLAVKTIKLSRMVFVQYPTGEDPENANKLVPNVQLATQLMSKIIDDQSISLGADSVGVGTEVNSSPSAKATASPTASPTPSPSTDPNVIAGLKGQTAAQRTCAVAASD